MIDNRYTKEAAARNIRDYYTPPRFDPNPDRKEACFAQAKYEYVQALRSQIAVAESLTFSDVFPSKKPAADQKGGE